MRTIRDAINSNYYGKPNKRTSLQTNPHQVEAFADELLMKADKEPRDLGKLQGPLTEPGDFARSKTPEGHSRLGRS